MYLQALRLRNFRNYKDAFFRFSPQINVISGENAQGKTNLLEALSLISRGSSFRANHLDELIKKGEKGFSIEAYLYKNGMKEQIHLTYQPGEKRLIHNCTKYSSFTNVLGILPSVIHLPTDPQLIGGAPLIRRRFLNMHFAQSHPLYTHYFLRYIRAMKQRNTLLKRCKNPDQHIAEFTAWECEMANSGAYLTFMRNQLIEQIQPAFSRYMTYLSSDEESAKIQFIPSIELKDHLDSLKGFYQMSFAANRKKDFQQRFTSKGPHRDDLSFTINSMSSKQFGSEGQKRSIAAAIRFAEWDLLSSSIEDAPILCVDDFGLGFDEKRKRLFRNKMDHFSQIFVTLPEPKPFFSGENVEVIRIENGSIYQPSKASI